MSSESDSGVRKSGRQKIPPQTKAGQRSFSLGDFLQTALLGSNAGSAALMAYRTGASEAPSLCWKALASLGSEALANPATKGYLVQLIREAFQGPEPIDLAASCILRSEAGMDLAPEWFKKTYQEQKELLSEVKAVCGKLNDAHQRNLVKALISHAVFLNNLDEDVPEEKETIAQHVVETFFKKDKLNCFIQASTQAVHLAEALAHTRETTAGCLLYTNSIAVPPAYLKEGARHAVYVFCGPSYDEECAAWLYPPGDDTEKELRKLFSPERGAPLTTSFLSPMVTTVGEGIFYRRTDTTEFTRVLVEGSKQLVIMSPANRVFETIDDYHENKSRHCALNWADLPIGTKEVILIIGPHPPTQHIPDWARRIARAGVQVHWYNAMDNTWKPEGGPLGRQEEPRA